MKCHWCGKDFGKVIYYDGATKKVERGHFECPDSHGEIWLNEEGEIFSYIFFFFSDDLGSRRYKIHKYQNGQISLFIRNMDKKGGYKKVLDIPNGPPMEIKNDIPQVQRMYERLKKLAVFA